MLEIEMIIQNVAFPLAAGLGYIQDEIGQNRNGGTDHRMLNRHHQAIVGVWNDENDLNNKGNDEIQNRLFQLNSQKHWIAIPFKQEKSDGSRKIMSLSEAVKSQVGVLVENKWLVVGTVVVVGTVYHTRKTLTSLASKAWTRCCEKKQA